jgi:hypothetical protein
MDLVSALEALPCKRVRVTFSLGWSAPPDGWRPPRRGCCLSLATLDARQPGTALEKRTRVRTYELRVASQGWWTDGEIRQQCFERISTWMYLDC